MMTQISQRLSVIDLKQRGKIIGSLLAVVIGIVVGFIVIGFRKFIDLVQYMLLGTEDNDIFTYVDSLHWTDILFSTLAGGIAVSLLFRFIMKSNRAYSVADVMTANAINNAVIPTRKGLISAVISSVALGAGSSAGREGLVVHLGATLSSWLSQKLGLRPNTSRVALGCGVAAAISASFNAPIAGVFFSLEVILGHYALSAFAPIVLASVTATIVSRIYIGDFPAFIIPNYHITTFWEFPAFILLGITSGVAAIIFLKSIAFTEDISTKIPIPEWTRPILGSLAVGLLALISPYILGHGYGTTNAALTELLSLKLLLLLIILKIAATSVSLAFRFGTGILSPSLFLGAMVGGAFGFMASRTAEFFGYADFSYGLYAILGMGAVAAAVLGAPISIILIIFELTGDYQITIALMVSVVIANLITQHFLEVDNFFKMELKNQGIDLEGGRSRHAMQSTYVRSLMINSYTTASSNVTVGQIHDMLLAGQHDHIFILDDNQRIIGTMTVAELRVAYAQEKEDEKDTLAIASSPAITYARDTSIVLTSSDNLEDAFQKFASSGEETLPVVTDDVQTEIIGILRLKYVLQAYNKALLDEKE